MGKRALTLVDILSTVKRGLPIIIDGKTLLTPLAQEYLSQHREIIVMDKSKPGNRTPLIAGNWKMHKTMSETAAFLSTLKERLRSLAGREVAVCPPFTSLVIAREILKDSNIKLGAQDMHWEPKGAFTGAVSPQMLRDVGCDSVIIGHSERRQYFAETDESVNKKTKAAFAAGLQPITCMGETDAERTAGDTFKVLERQIDNGLVGLEQWAGVLVIAYEPVWAIGTGKTATPAQAQEVHAFIRKKLGEMFGFKNAQTARILYGGSVKPDNVSQIMAQPDVDGALVGGASLDCDSFVKLVMYE